jgi:hypothetical protein
VSVITLAFNIPRYTIAQLVILLIYFQTSANEPMTNENPLLVNMLNMANFIQMAQQHPTTSSTDTLNALCKFFGMFYNLE